LGAAPARRRYSAVILTEDGEKVVGSEPDAAAASHPADRPESHPAEHPADRPVSRPAEHPADRSVSRPAQHPADRPESHPAEHPASSEPAPTFRPRIARRPPSTDRVLPDITSDEGDVGWGEVPEPDDDERLLRDVPPHHGS
jgi:hypothetical protein